MTATTLGWELAFTLLDKLVVAVEPRPSGGWELAFTLLDKLADDKPLYPMVAGN